MNARLKQSAVAKVQIYTNTENFT